jgi:Kef-type K+ transport system membrane component KefB
MNASLAEALLALAAILAGARVVGALAVRLRQPRIGGEMIAGLLIGAALLSPWRDVGARHHAVLGAPAVQFIDLLGQVGMILYLLLVGLTLSPSDLRRNTGRIAAVSLPVLIAAAALAPIGVDWFAGTRWQLAGGAAGAIAITAALMINGFPLVARILQERELLHGEFGATVLGSSAALTTLALILVAVAAHRFRSPGPPTAGYVLWLVAIVTVGIGVALAWPSLAARSRFALGEVTGTVLAVITALLAAWASVQLLGSGLLGAFLVGIALSQSSVTRSALERALGRSVPVILVPVFMAAAGARVDPRTLGLSVLAGAAVFTVLLVAVACLAGSVSSRFSVLGASDATAIAVLLNCRGLMLLVLGVEMSDHRLIGSRLVAVFFIGAVATTAMTGPMFAGAQRRAHRAASQNRVRPPSWSIALKTDRSPSPNTVVAGAGRSQGGRGDRSPRLLDSVDRND